MSVIDDRLDAIDIWTTPEGVGQIQYHAAANPKLLEAMLAVRCNKADALRLLKEVFEESLSAAISDRDLFCGDGGEA